MSNQMNFNDDENRFISKDKTFEIEDCMKESAVSEMVDGTVKSFPVNPLCSLNATVMDGRVVTLTWKHPDIILKCYLLNYKESTLEIEWRRVNVSKQENTYVFDQLLFGTEYSFKLLGIDDRHREVLLTETVHKKTVELDAPQIISVSLKEKSVILKWKAVKFEISKYCFRYKLGDDWSVCFIELENVLLSYKNDKLLSKVKLCCDKPGNYCFQIQSISKFGESKWSEEFCYSKSKDDEDFPDIDHDYDDDDIKNFYHENDVITDNDIYWAIKSYARVLEINSSAPAKSKSISTMRLLQNITRMKYQSFNIPLKWHGQLGMHSAVNHPMDILHDFILKADFSLRSKLYQKLAFCHLSVPVLFPSVQDLYMNLSLRSIICARRENDKLIEENVTKSPLCVVSMMRIGQQAVSSLSKSKLCNDLLGFNVNTKKGSCGFYTRDSLSSKMNRKTSEGTVEGVWYHNISHKRKEFSKPFSLLNLRGDALHLGQSAVTLASASDVLFALCGVDMFKDEQHLGFLIALAESKNQSTLKKLVVLMTKESASCVKSRRVLFNDVCPNVRYKIIDENYHKLLETVTVEIEETLESSLQILSLNERFSQLAPEYILKNSKARDISESFLKELDLLKNSNAQEKAQIRKKLFPIQSTIKRYAEAQKKETRTRNLDQKYKYRDEILAVKKEQSEIIQKDFPHLMSKFLKEIFKCNGIEAKIRYLSDVKDYMDDWSFSHLSDVRNQYSIATKELNLLKRKQTKSTFDESSFSIEQRKLEMRCDNLSIYLLNISIGVETIIREIGGIYEALYRNQDNLNKELSKYMNMLPELAASLLLNGIALELIDGDGLSVPVTWLKEVFKVFKISYMEYYNLKHEPRIFVLTVLGTQSSGKSTLLNTMFGIQFPVSAGRCTKGAYLQMIPVFLENYKNDVILVVDTEGLGAPEYKSSKTHDNEIATFVLGISDVAIVNVRGELPNDIENFLEVSICALMRMNMVDFHPNVVFVHQNCDPSAKEKNLSGRNTFMKLMDEVVVAQARIMQKSYRHFQDIVDISLENDIFYFPQLLEGSGSMAPPNQSYSEACSELRDHIINKMASNKMGSLCLEDLCKKIETVWNGVLEENFVLSLNNNAEIQVKYEIENEVSIWRSKIECSLNEYLETAYNEIKASFKSRFEANACRDYLATKLNEFSAKSVELNNAHAEAFVSFIDKKTNNRNIFLNWKQRYINRMEQNIKNVVRNCHGCIEKYFNDQQNSLEFENELMKSKADLQKHTRKVAEDLLKKRKDQDIGNVEFSKEECESEFQIFWNGVIGNLSKRQNKMFIPADVTEVFKQELYMCYGQTAKFNSTIKRFGDRLENKFKVEWINLSEHFEWKKSFLAYINIVHDKAKSFTTPIERDLMLEIEDMISLAIHRIQITLLCLRDIGGVKQLKFQPYAQFDCTLFVQQYMKRAVDILKDTYSRAKCSEKFVLTSTFIALFACYAAQIAFEKFSFAQESYFVHNDLMEKIKRERESTKDLFLSILANEKDISIAARQIRALFLIAAKKQALVSVRSVLKELVLKRITQKLHVHGLVLRDVVEIVSKKSKTEEEMTFVETYFNDPFVSFEDKISEIINDNKEADISTELNLKINAIFEKLKTKCLNKFVAHGFKSFKVNICEYSVIKKLGIGEKDFDVIVELGSEKKMEVEKELITKVASLIECADSNLLKLSPEEEWELKSQLINDIKNHLFQCKVKCPFCRAPCNQTHADDSNDHSSRCHRPQGFGDYTEIDSSEFVIGFCNDYVTSNCSFKNNDTKNEWVPYKDYKSVGPRYLSWEIDGTASDHYLYWKYITYHAMQILDKFYPDAVKKDVSSWREVTKVEAINVINNCFYLDGANVRIVNGRHIV